MTYGRRRGSGPPNTSSQRSRSVEWRTTRSRVGAWTAMRSTSLAGRLVQAEARALVVLADDEASEARDRVRIVSEVIADVAPELAHPRELPRRGHRRGRTGMGSRQRR